MSTKGALGCRGLKTAGNPLTYEPASLGIAQNCVIPSKDLLEPRRGQPVYSHAFGAATDTALQMGEWRSQLLVHYGTTTAGTNLGLLKTADAAVDGNTFTNAGTLVAPDPTTRRARFASMSNNLYATSASGLVVLTSETDSLALAGVSRPLDPQPQYAALTGNPNATGTWFSADNAVAYRACFVKKDVNGNVKLSGASGRIVVVNPADVTVAIGGLSRTAGNVTAVVSAHEFQAGDIFALTPGEVNYPAANYTVSSVATSAIVYASAGSAAVSTAEQTITSGTKNTLIYVLMPAPGSSIGLEAGDFVQLYRTEGSGAAATDPGDECFLCYERQLSATDISNTYHAITDTTPDSFLGAPLYSNANTGEGATQSNEKPPQCNDICIFDGRLWGADTTDRQRLTIRLLGVGSPNGIQTGDLIAIGGTVRTVTATTAYLPSKNILYTASQFSYSMSIARGSSGGNNFTARVLFDGDSPTGQILVEDIDPAGSVFYAATNRPSAFQDPLPTVTAVASSGLTRLTNVVTATTSTAHGFAVGDVVMVAFNGSGSADADFALGLKTVASVPGATSFTYAETGSNDTLAAGQVYYVYAAKYGSSNGARQLRFSKQGQPEAWPLSNWIGGLPDGETVTRIMPLIGSLFVFMEKGDIYTVSGTYPYNVQKFDGTASLLAADTLVEHAGRLHCLTTQGVCAISDTGVQVLSYDIERDLRVRIASLSAAQLARSFAVSYESDRQYQLWMPDASAPTSLTCTGAWVYQSDSATWTTWGGTTSTTRANRTCGTITKSDNLLTLGDGDTGSLAKPQNKPRKESKSYTVTDIVDYQLTFTGSGNDTTKVITPAAASSIFYVQAGDVLTYDGDYALVTANNGSTLTYSGSLADPISAAIICYMQVPTSLEWLIDAGGSAGVEKHWQEFQLHYAYVNTPTLTALFLNERSVAATSSVTITPPDYTAVQSPLQATEIMRTLRAGVPAVMQRAAMLRLRVTTTGLAYWRLLGWSHTSEGIGAKTP